MVRLFLKVYSKTYRSLWYLVSSESKRSLMKHFLLSLFLTGIVQCSFSQSGCIDPSACNYNNPNLSACRYIGQSCNRYAEFDNSYYDSDCGCIELYKGGYNGDAIWNDQDLAGLLEEFGRGGVDEDAIGDISGDMFVNVSDIAIFFALFGQSLN